jgi:hypothetical protein
VEIYSSVARRLIPASALLGVLCLSFLVWGTALWAVTDPNADVQVTLVWEQSPAPTTWDTLPAGQIYQTIVFRQQPPEAVSVEISRLSVDIHTLATSLLPPNTLNALACYRVHNAIVRASDGVVLSWTKAAPLLVAPEGYKLCVDPSMPPAPKELRLQ